MDYYLGLDVGSASVGWAVCDENYNLCRFKNKDMWGIRLFEMAQTAAERRVKRASRRRLERRKQRIDLLQEIFAEEMAKEDSTFFIRLNESRLHLEDKSGDSKYPLFSDEGYTDLEYYMEYPTIFHLRKELLQSSEVHDVRLVYLALHHLIKYRGHFLVQGTSDSVKNFEAAFDRLIEVLNNEMDLNISISEDNKNRFQSILKDKKKPRSIKAKELAQLFDFEDNGEDAIPLKSQKGIVEQVCKLVVGNKGDLAKLFMISKDCFDISTCSFADAQYEESIRDGLNDVLMEKALILDLIKTIYDWSILTDILQEEAFISLAKVKQYEEHGKNLGLLRRILLKYTNKSVYNDFFNNEKGKNNYVSYIGQVKKNGKKYSVVRCNEDDFYKELKSILEKIQVEESDLETKNRLLQGCETGDLLPLQRGKENAVIPYQIHELELKQILDNASGYLTFLTLKDADGISNREKIEKLLTFRIPYYVGPLSDRHKEQGANVCR